MARLSGQALARYEEQLLLGGRWAPVTDTMVFYRASPQECVDTLLDMRGQRMYVRRFGALPRVREVRGDDLESLLHQLLPLHRVEADKFLFVRTRNPQWTAVFTDESFGGGATSVPMTAWGIEQVAVAEMPHTHRPLGWHTFDGGERKFSWRWLGESYVERGKEYRDAFGTLRLFWDEAGRWEWQSTFMTGGKTAPAEVFPEPLGVVGDPSARRKPDRLTHEHLRAACEKLGLFPFDADFYAPDGRGLILERGDAAAAELPGYTLAQARGEEDIPGV